MTAGESGQPLAELSKTDLQALEQAWAAELTQVSGANQKLDLSRGKPGAEQLSLSDALETMIAGDYISADGTDTRNYGGLMGIAEARMETWRRQWLMACVRLGGAKFHFR